MMVMEQLKLSTKMKAAVGYAALIALFVAAVWLIVGELNSLTVSDGSEQTINYRQRATNDVVTRLYQAEVIGQALSAGRVELFQQYADAMVRTAQSVDSLRAMVSDKAQLARLDSMKMLLGRKVDNMEALLDAMEADNSDELYQQYINDLINSGNAEVNVPKVTHSQTVRTSEYVVHRKRKNFFGRLRDAFSKDDKNPDHVSETVTEHRVDTVAQRVNPADTVARMLASVRKRVDGRRMGQIAQLKRQTAALRINGQQLSQKVGELLGAIVDESARSSAQKHRQVAEVRHSAVLEIAGIAFAALLLAVVFLFLIWRDITRSNHYRRELEKAKQRAEDLLEARERLMLTITHDIKAPVGSIIGYADLLGGDALGRRGRRYLENMQSSARHLLDLVNSLLDFHRLDADKMDVETSAFNARQLLDAIAGSYRPAAAAKCLRLDYDCSASLASSFMGDPFRLRQIVENLMSNAMKFTQEGSVTLRADYADGWLTVTVADTGCGISEDERQRIFQEFTRLKSAQGQEGFGLGLSITQKLVALLGGDISVDSVEGEGSTFKVVLPLPPSDEASDDMAGELPAKARFGRNVRLLLIDDDRLQLQLTEAMLRSLGADVVTCTEPQQLFVAIAEGCYDAVLTDIQMPAMNGFDLLRTVRALGCEAARRIPVIAVTARGDIDAEALRGEGFAGCLHKPFSRDDIVSVVEAAVDRGDVAGYDFSALTAFSVDDAEAAAEIMHSFVAETRGNIDRMRRAVAASDLSEMAEAAHKMLPLFTMIGVDRAIEPLTALNSKRGGGVADSSDIEMAQDVIEEAEKVVESAVKVNQN